MKVVAADLDAAALDAAVVELRAKSIDVTGVLVDVTKRESLESLRDAAIDAYGAVHVVCNNAGVANTAFGNVWEHENVDWRWSLEVHLFGVINGCAAFVPWLLEHGDEGWIVNTVSGNGGIVPMPDSAPYALAKASIVTYTECLWAQLRDARLEDRGVAAVPLGLHARPAQHGYLERKRSATEFAPSTPGPCAAASSLRRAHARPRPGGPLHAARRGGRPGRDRHPRGPVLDAGAVRAHRRPDPRAGRVDDRPRPARLHAPRP